MVTIYSVIDALTANNNLKANMQSKQEALDEIVKSIISTIIIHNLQQPFSTIHNFFNYS